MEESTMGMEEITLDDIEQKLLPNVKARLKTIKGEIENQTMSLQDVEHFFGQYKDDKEKLETELRKIITKPNTNQDSVVKFVKTLDRYFTLEQVYESAKTIDECKQRLELTGNFTSIEIILKLTDDLEQETLQAITKPVIKAITHLESVTESQIECLATFLNCSKIVDWTKNFLKDPSQLNNFATISLGAVGGDPVDMAKITVFQSAINGYAPLIYGLTAEDGWEAFIEKCQRTWESLGKDEMLPKSLVDSEAILDWLRNLTSIHGTTGVQYIDEMKAINAKGYYQVGDIGGKQVGVDGTIQMVLNKDDLSTNMKQRWTYNDIKDLRSKLLLVCGKDTENVEGFDRFLQILEHVTHLANAWEKLVSAGDLFFLNMQTEIFGTECIHSGNYSIGIKTGRKMEDFTGQGDPKSHLSELCSFMENCVERWKCTIEKSRREYPILNHFTIQQLNVIRKQVACFVPGYCGEATPDNDLFTLLNVAGIDSNEPTLANTVHDCYGELSRGEVISKRMDICSVPGNLGAFKTFMMEVIQYDGVNDKIAKAAFQACKGDVENGTAWCITHTDSSAEAEVEREYTNFTQSNYADIGDVSRGSVLEDAVQGLDSRGRRERRRDSGEDQNNEEYTSVAVRQLESAWAKYQENQTFGEHTHVSVGFVGLVLDRLFEESKTTCQLPKALEYIHVVEKGKPNLFLVPEREILKACLSLYPVINNRILMPNSGDVLLCSDKTTKEEIDLFMNRVFTIHTSERLFCMLFPHRLDYSMTRSVKEAFQSLSQGNTAYHLSIISAQESEFHDIVTTFESHRKNIPRLYEDGQLRDFLSNLKYEDGLASAAWVDEDKMCARIVKSSEAGNGKSLFIKRLFERLECKSEPLEGVTAGAAVIKIPVHGKTLESEVIAETLLKTKREIHAESVIYHIDVYPSVRKGIDEFLFSIIILRQIANKDGLLWKRLDSDFYVIEMQDYEQTQNVATPSFPMYMPETICLSPADLSCHSEDYVSYAGHQYIHYDEMEFFSDKFRRVHHYLTYLESSTTTFLKKYKAQQTHFEADEAVEFLNLLIRWCGLNSPTWSVLNQFVTFLNDQLMSWETNSFCGPESDARHLLPGFPVFALKLFVAVAKDFAVPSSDISDESIGNLEEKIPADICTSRRKWEEMAHPYIFFNKDQQTMTFHGFKIGPKGILISPTNRKVVSEIRMTRRLKEALMIQGVNFALDFDDVNVPRGVKVKRICIMLGLTPVDSDKSRKLTEDQIIRIYEDFDPDKTYELTNDNVTKMMGILVRFRCNLPVVIMGETGCGKTRLVSYLCSLMSREANQAINVEEESDEERRPGNFMVMKVHGGTTANDIVETVKTAMERTRMMEEHNVDTVLFFDEANTTEYLGLFKEVMFDRSLFGVPLKTDSLKFVAACNPFRKHGDKAIKYLEAAGLGFRVTAMDTEEKIGEIPLRHLVYRVQPLPPSLLALVWDFGQLSDNVEKTYIESIVRNRVVLKDQYALKAIELLVSVVKKSQGFMKNQDEECRFVSLRDIERIVLIYQWLYDHYELFEKLMDEEEKRKKMVTTAIGANKEAKKVQRCTVLSAGICYHACLRNRERYRKCIAKCFKGIYALADGQISINYIIDCCQTVFLNSIPLNDKIAKNEALKENVFMLAICLQLRIPIFLVGKPGSSKSLSTTIIDNMMKGTASASELLKQMKAIQMWSCQCSQHSTPEDIIETFTNCAIYQREQRKKETARLEQSLQGQNRTEKISDSKDKYVGVVLLDEVGLAEDSPLMPLKTLHPLLESGSIEDEENPKPWKKVGFIGLSNWALDPAKMNRGVFVVRDVPSLEELKMSARGICASTFMESLIEPLSLAYLNVFQKCTDREYFGLRDFYCLVKMVSQLSGTKSRNLTWNELRLCIVRNFGGHETINVDEFQDTCEHLCHAEDETEGMTENIFTPTELITSNLSIRGSTGDTRYLLLITKNAAAHNIVMGMTGTDKEPFFKLDETLIIYGSRFENDQEYTKVCRDIRRIKVCMEIGQPVILINAEYLYESLYDTMNQYYLEIGDLRFVNIGLGTSRFKALVHRDFRLLVIAEREAVQKYPIPLINRLEKHYIVMKDVLTMFEREIVDELENWINDFTVIQHQRKGTKVFQPKDVFIGYHGDAVSSIVHDECANTQTGLDFESAVDEEQTKTKIMNIVKSKLIQSCTPDSIVRLQYAEIEAQEANEITEVYFQNKCHSSLSHCLEHFVFEGEDQTGMLIQISTHGKLLVDMSDLDTTINSVYLINLQQFTSEQKFRELLADFYSRKTVSQRTRTNQTQLLILQCSYTTRNVELVPFVRFLITDERRKYNSHNSHLVLVVQQPRFRAGNFLGFQGSPWTCVHIDDIRCPTTQSPEIPLLLSSHIGALFENGTLDITSILKMCVHEAMALIDWYDETSIQAHYQSNNSLTTKYIIILLDLLERHVPFTECLGARVTLLLNETWTASDWATEEALRVECLQEGGTFRRTLVLKICRLVTPVLSEVLAYVMRNNSLDLLHQSSENNWIDNLLIGLFKDPSLTPIVKSWDVKRFSLQIESSENEWKVPFSFLIHDSLESNLHLKLKTDVQLMDGDDIRTERFGQQLWASIEKEALGKLIKFSVRGDRKTFFDHYLHDFVLMKNKWTPEEMVFVKEAIMAAVNEIRIEHEEKVKHLGREADPDDYHNIADIHVVYNNVKSRLQSFTELIHKVPHLLQKREFLDNLQADQKDEMIIDAAAVFHALDIVEPKTRDLTKEETRQNWLYSILPCVRMVTTQVVSLLDSGHCGAISQELIKKCRLKWNTLHVIYLFVQQVYSAQPDPKDLKFAFTYCKVLKAEKEKTNAWHMEKIQELLKTCVKNAAYRYFAKGVANCAQGKHDLDEPVGLSCGHLCCSQCFDVIREIGKCPICETVLPEDTEAIVNIQSRESTQKYYMYRRRCNMFFLDMVSTFYLKADSKPEEGVIRKLFGYIKAEEGSTTGNISFLEGSDVDATPVVRSFLLRLVLQYGTENDDVKTWLQQYLDEYLKVCGTIRSRVDLLVLYTQCVEDYLSRQQHVEVKLKNALRALTRIITSTEMETDSDLSNTQVQGLHDIACVKSGIALLADSVYNIHEKQQLQQVPERMLPFSSEMTGLIETDAVGASTFLIKYLCRTYSLDVLDVTLRDKTSQHMVPTCLQPHQVDDKMSRFDFLLVTGNTYKSIRDIFNTVERGNTDYTELCHRMTTALEAGNQDDCDSPGMSFVAFLLALYHEVTLTYEDGDSIDEEVIAVYEESVNQMFDEEEEESLPNLFPPVGIDFQRMKSLALNLLRNLQGCPEDFMTLTSVKVTQSDHHFITLLVHVLAVVVASEKNEALEFFAALVDDPANMKDAFLPTMPDNDTRQEQTQLEGSWYRCSVGHPYFREAQKDSKQRSCPQCGVYADSTKDSLLQSAARHLKGHILGRPEDRRGETPFPLRDIHHISVAVIRLVTHACMLLGCIDHTEDIIDMINGRADDLDVTEFLFGHMREDIHLLSKALGSSHDEAFIIVHMFLTEMSKASEIDLDEAAFDFNTNSKESRAKWESAIAETFVRPVVKNFGSRLETLRRDMIMDAKLDNNPLISAIYELDDDLPTENATSLCRIPDLWSFRVRFSLDQLGGILEDLTRKEREEKGCQVLHEFLQWERWLRALRFLPDVIELQKVLRRIYHLRITEREAEDSTTESFISKYVDVKPNLGKLVESFCTAWKLVKRGITIEGLGGIDVPEKYCIEEGNQTNIPISMMIPTVVGRGICSLALVDALISVQNIFLHRFAALKGFLMSSQRVRMADVTTFHLIAYDHEEDLEPLITAHRDYTLEVDKENRIDYDFAALERQIINKFIEGKSLIVRETFPFAYSDSVCDKMTFANLRRRVPQEILGQGIQQDITNELRYKMMFPDLCTSLRAVHLAIGFLSATGGDQNMTIHKYLQDILRVPQKDGIHSEKARKTCLLSHTLALWQLMSVEQAKEFIKGNSDPFEEIDANYKEDLPDIEDLNEVLRRIDVHVLLKELYEFILLEMKSSLKVSLEPTDRLVKILNEFLTNKSAKDIKGLEKLPDKLQLKHSVDLWLRVNKYQTDIEVTVFANE
ncbi:E3 ubiquitin-protein ligase rnf213-alpha-like [Glandiceps talaboti]